MDISQHELETIQRMVLITNALIELQREFIEHLNRAGSDVSVAKRDFEDMTLGLAAWVQQRHRLRASFYQNLPRDLKATA